MTEEFKPVRRLTTQGAFNKMVRHLREQGRKSENAGGDTCMYRNPEGLKCAVGALIPDRLYSEELEYATLDSEKVGELFKGFDAETLQMMRKMQRIHDHRYTIDWEDYFEALAEEYRLKLEPKEKKSA